MVWVIGVVLKDQRLLFNDGVALLADVLAQAPSFLAVMARATKVPDVNEGGQNVRCVKKV